MTGNAPKREIGTPGGAPVTDRNAYAPLGVEVTDGVSAPNADPRQWTVRGSPAITGTNEPVTLVVARSITVRDGTTILATGATKPPASIRSWKIVKSSPFVESMIGSNDQSAP